MPANLFLSLGYGLNLIALTVKDVLVLRTVLLPAQVSFLTWGARNGIVTTIVINGLFIGINLFHVIRIIRERRPIALPDDLASIYENVFPDMRPREFLMFWETGREGEVVDDRLLREGEAPEEVFFIVSGKATVEQGGKRIARLGQGHFAGEMSFLTNSPASASVHADGTLRYVAWNQRKLAALDSIDPHLSIKIQRALSRDLSAKASRSVSGMHPVS